MSALVDERPCSLINPIPYGDILPDNTNLITSNFKTYYDESNILLTIFFAETTHQVFVAFSTDD